MTDLSDKTVLFYDASGGYVHMAESVVNQFGNVLYHAPWETAFPAAKDYVVGTGLDGIERIDDFFAALDRTDLVVFTDVGMGGLQQWLRQQGMPVFGSGAAGQVERDRWFLKSICKRYQLDCADAIPVTGVENLRDILGAMEDKVHVKLTRFRGDAETFKHENQLDTTRWLNELALKMEPLSASAEFVIEQSIDAKPCVEVGADLPVNVGGLYPTDPMWGYEIKDEVYAGRAGPLPERLKTVVDKLAPVLQAFDYRGAMSTETRETREGSFFLDFTARFPNPPSALWRFMILNWGELMWEAAHGRIVEPEYAARVGVEIILHSDYGRENPLRVTVGRWDRTVLYGHAAADGSDYAVSPAQIPECGGACGLGSNLTEALEEAYEVAEAVKGRDLAWDAGSLEQLTEEIQTGTELGIGWA